MKRSGFTMIELIFVIVILGILAAVALPKFIGVSEQAQVGKLKGYVGTLNRTAAPALWSKSISAGTAGKISTKTYNTELNNTLAPLENITDTGGAFSAYDMTQCAASTTADPALNSSDTTATNAISSGTVGGKVYYVKCIDGNMSASPRFFLTDSATVIAK